MGSVCAVVAKSSIVLSTWDPFVLQLSREVRSRPREDRDREVLGRQHMPKPLEWIDD